MALFRDTIRLFCLLLSVSSNYGLFEGESCTANNKKGTCVVINKCLSAFLDVKARKNSTVCSFQGSIPVVCCTDCELVEDTRNAIVDQYGGVYFKTGQKAHDKCLEYLTQHPGGCPSYGVFSDWDPFKNCTEYRIMLPLGAVGGMDAQRDEYPHMALLGFGSDKESAQWLCGGSVISDRYVLTAAHCLSSSGLGQVSFIALGILKRTDPIDLWQIYQVIKAIPHPEYKSPSKYHDIALLQTDRQIKFSTSVYPACVHYTQEGASEAVATGWGALGTRQQLADNLQSVRLKEFSKEECSRQYPKHRLLLNGYNHASQMCYGDDKAQRDTCQGDSGGPLQVKSAMSPCMYSVIGVTSYGRACGQVGASGMYTRLLYYVPWIESIVW